MISDAAAAIEALEARLGEAENSVERWKDMYLTKHEPKLGEWIWDDKRCIYVCSVCGSPKVRENMDRQIIKEQAYCYSCGAKMEVQE